MSREITLGDYVEVVGDGITRLYPIIALSLSPLEIYIRYNEKGDEALIQPLRGVWQIVNYERPHQLTFYSREQIFPQFVTPLARSPESLLTKSSATPTFLKSNQPKLPPSGIISPRKRVQVSTSPVNQLVSPTLVEITQLESAPIICSNYQIGRADQDRFVTAQINNQGKLYAVFDGHGGSTTANMLSKSFPKFLSKYLQEIDVNRPEFFGPTFQQAIDNFEKEILYKERVEDGSTATMLFLTDKLIYTINIGDSRIVIFNGNGQIIGQTIDHNPERDQERNRIEAIGHKVINGRVDGSLAISRAFADFSYKLDSNDRYSNRFAVSLQSDILVYRLDDYQGPIYAWLASDGIYQLMDSQQSNEMITREILLQLKYSNEKACENIVTSLRTRTLDELSKSYSHEESLKYVDDITLLIVRLK